MADSETRAVIILQADQQSAAATKRLLSDVSAGVKDLGKANQLKGLDQSFDRFDASLTDTGKRFERLTAEIKKTQIAAESLSKVKIDAFDSIGEENFADPSGGGGKGGLGTRITKFGQNLRNLPSTQIPGLGIGTDAIGNLSRLGGVLVGVGEKASLVTTITAGLTPVLGATAAGIGGLVIAAAPLIIAFVAVGAAIKSLADQAASEAEKINAIVDAQRQVGQDIAKGLDTAQAQEKLEELNRLREDEAARIAALQQTYKENIESQGALTGVVKLTSGAEQALADQIEKGKGLVKGYESDIAALSKAMGNGSLAANDAKVAEEARNKEREKADQEAEQLAKQSAAKAEAAAKKRADDIENTQKRIEESTLKFNQKQQDDARQAAQKLEDIERGARDKRSDLARKYSDDLINIGVKAQRDEIDAARKNQQTEADARLKDQQSAIDAAVKQQQVLEDIRKDALRSETDQLRQRNFLGASLAGEAAQEQIDDANLNAERETKDRLAQQDREAQERALGYQRESQDRQIANQRARIDRAVAYQQEQRDAVIAYDRQIRDAEIAQQRQEQTTLIGYEREQAQLQEHMNKLLGITAEGQAAERALKSGENVALRNSNNTTNNNGGNTNVNDYRAMTFNAGSMGGMQSIEAFRRIALQVQRETRYG